MSADSPDSPASSNNSPRIGPFSLPSEPSDNIVRMPPRQPTSLQGLLRFAMEASKAEDAPGNSEFGPMDEERRRFLEDAVRGMTVNVAVMLKNSIDTLCDAELMKTVQLGQDLPEEVLAAFENLIEYIDDIDVANDFHKIGGFSMFPVCYNSENEEVRTFTNHVLGELCQNNPDCQRRALECGLLNLLLSLVRTERGKAQAKCVFAISCAVREYEPSCRELIAQGGCETMAQILTNSEMPARIKAAYFIKYLCSNSREACEKFVNLNLVPPIAVHLRTRHDESTEILLELLVVLVASDDPRVLDQVRDPAAGLQRALQGLMPVLRGAPHRSARSSCRRLLELGFPQSPPPADQVEEGADR